jgi:hypothetical protein
MERFYFRLDDFGESGLEYPAIPLTFAHLPPPLVQWSDLPQHQQGEIIGGRHIFHKVEQGSFNSIQQAAGG